MASASFAQFDFWGDPIRPTVLTLFDVSGSLTEDNEFRDVDGRTAYYCQIVNRNPISTKITRIADWPRRPVNARREPWTSWLYFTSNERIEGYVKFGGADPTPMAGHSRPVSSTSESRIFTALDSQVYYWAPGSRSRRCYDTNDTLMAVYEYLPDVPEFAKLDIKEGSEHMLTEIITTLLLNRHVMRREGPPG